MIGEGDRVHLQGTGEGKVRYLKGSSARVAFDSGKERTVPLARLVSRERKPIAMGSTMEPITSSAEISGDLPNEPPRITYQPEQSVGQRAPFLRSAKYLDHVRAHQCCNPGCTATCRSEAHHWSHEGAVMGAKVDDYRTVPLCPMCHYDFHATGSLPGMDPVGTRVLFVATEAVTLQGWLSDLLTKSDPEAYIDAAVDMLRTLS